MASATVKAKSFVQGTLQYNADKSKCSASAVTDFGMDFHTETKTGTRCTRWTKVWLDAKPLYRRQIFWITGTDRTERETYYHGQPQA